MMPRDAISSPSEISYANTAPTALTRRIIRSLENATGRPKLLRMASGYAEDVGDGRDFWAVMQERYGLTFDLDETDLDRIPQTGPVVCIANHPYGILDGLAMGRLMSMRRPDFKIVAHTVFSRAQDVSDHILPISFDGTLEAQRANLETRRKAVEYLKAGGAVAIFPGGTVSTASKPFGKAIDPEWKTFTARLIARSNAAVVPIFFEGSNSRLFQIFSHVSQTLRTGLFIREFGRRVGTPVDVRVGHPVDPDQIDLLKADPAGMMNFLRAVVYALSPVPYDDLDYGWTG